MLGSIHILLQQSHYYPILQHFGVSLYSISPCLSSPSQPLPPLMISKSTFKYSQVPGIRNLGFGRAMVVPVLCL